MTQERGERFLTVTMGRNTIGTIRIAAGRYRAFGLGETSLGNFPSLAAAADAISEEADNG